MMTVAAQTIAMTTKMTTIDERTGARWRYPFFLIRNISANIIDSYLMI